MSGVDIFLPEKMFKSANDLTSLLCDEWKEVINMSSVNWDGIISVLNKEKEVFPPKKDIFNALNNCHPDKVKVVIVGQDPYYNRGQAHGYSFSVQRNVSIPPSLANIFKELVDELNMKTFPPNGCLEKWEKEGVLLLNSILTVRAGAPDSHKGIGWETFTSEVIEWIDDNCNVVFLAWGRQAETICSKVKRNKVIVTGHPSPRNTANPFVGCGCFRKVNDELMAKNILPVRWNILW